MSAVNRIFKLAEKFAIKLAQETSQAMEAPDFFFGKGYNFGNFQQALGQLTVVGEKASGDKSLAKLMADYFNKTQQNVSVNISVEIKPGVGARWVTQITPPAFSQIALGELNKQYQAVTGKNWNQGQADASAAAKTAKSVEGSPTAVIVDKGL